MKPIVCVVAGLAMLAASRHAWADPTRFTLTYTDNFRFNVTANLMATGPTTDYAGAVTNAYQVIGGSLHVTSTAYPDLNGAYSLYSSGPTDRSLIYPGRNAHYLVAGGNIYPLSYLDGKGLTFSNAQGTQISIWGNGLAGKANLFVVGNKLELWDPVLQQLTETTLTPAEVAGFGTYGFGVQGSGSQAGIAGDWPFAGQVTLAQSAPEPASLTLFGLGALGLAGFGRRRWVSASV